MRENGISGGLFGVSEAAEMLGVHTNTVRRWSSRGLLKAYRIGPRGDRRFRQEDLDAFVASLDGSGSNGEDERRVLIVDDDIEVQQVLRDIVERCGCEAVAVGSVERALEEIRRGPFDLIFLDPILRDSNGLDVLRAIEDNGERTVVAIIVGYGDTPTALEAMSLGPMFFVHKPLETKHIAKILDTVQGGQS
ncbi:MAG: response regulator [Dehalococcoidia bacterium]